MSRRTRPTDREQEADEPRSRRAPAKNGFPVGPILILVVLLGGALVGARWISQNSEDEGEERVIVDDRHVPFGGMARETGTPPGTTGTTPAAPTKNYEKPPTGMLAGNDVWIQALKDAAKADSLFAEAQNAMQGGDNSTFRVKGKEAKHLFSKILTDTRVLEEEMLETYGDRDPQTREVIRKCNYWRDRLQILSKTTGR